MNTAVAGQVLTSSGKFSIADLTDPQFKELAEIIYQKFGIHLPPSKKELVPRRLSKRLSKMGFADYGEYIQYLKENWQSEQQLLANAITTNLTSFFREQHHFDFLEQSILPELIEKHAMQRRLRIWSAGCSSGEEAYSIAMTVQRFEAQLKNWDVKLLATDLDTNILQTAFDAQYTADQLSKVPASEKLRWCQSVDADGDVYDIDAQLKSMITFKRLNFMDTWPMKGKFDVIFCRNVLIYFDQETQRRIIKGFAGLQNKGDYLLAGHSENLQPVTEQYALVGKTIYQRL